MKKWRSSKLLKVLLLMFSQAMKCWRESTYCLVVSLLLPSAKYVLETNHVVSKITEKIWWTRTIFQVILDLNWPMASLEDFKSVREGFPVRGTVWVEVQGYWLIQNAFPFIICGNGASYTSLLLTKLWFPFWQNLFLLTIFELH